MRPWFVDEEVEVRFEQQPGPPTSFVWRGQEYRIVAILEEERRLDLRRTWWRRRHRDLYVVKTEEGRVFKLYHHRGPGRRHWVLYEELSDGGHPERG
jgi:hypothetical protein